MTSVPMNANVESLPVWPTLEGPGGGQAKSGSSHKAVGRTTDDTVSRWIGSFLGKWCTHRNL